MKEENSLKIVREALPSVVPDKGWRSLKRAFEVLRKRMMLITVCFLTLFLGFCCFFYYRNLLTASTILSLDYEEASIGLTPNRTRFNIFEIQSAEVMERLIDYAGLGGRISPDELSKCIRVQPTHNQNVSSTVYYISTSYVVSFTDNGAIGGRTAEDMLALLCRAYREYFVEHYGFNHSILSFDIDDLKFNDEYLMTVDLLELKCTQLQNYVKLCRQNSKNFQDPNTGVTFSSLEQQAKNLAAYDIATLRSYVIENGIANDRAELGGMLDYKIRMDRLNYDKLMAAYDEDSRGIELYDAAMSAVVMIPTQDTSMNYYMSRTKTGMDNMAIHANQQLGGAMERMEQIRYNTYLAEKLEASTSDSAAAERADAMILEIERTLQKLASDIQTLDSMYTSTKARNYLGFTADNVSAADRIGLIPSFVCSVMAIFAAYFFVFLGVFLSDKEKEV